MFERYTERARRVVFFARYEASQFGSAAIETEHLLLGLIREDRNVMTRFVGGSWRTDIRKEIEARIPVREKVPTSIDMPLSQECKRILAYAAEEAERLNHRHIGTEHLLLGILREKTCVAAQILHAQGFRLEAVREKLSRTSMPRDEGTFGRVVVGIPNYVSPQGHVVPDAATAMRVAEDIWSRQYGDIIDSQRPLQAELRQGGIWVVSGSLATEASGSALYALISKADGRVLGFGRGRADVSTAERDIRANRRFYVDTETGLHNKRFFVDVLNAEIALADRDRHALTLLILDVDDFQLLSDLYGQVAGNSTLKLVAVILRSSVTREDFAFRCGWDEFAMLLPNTNLKVGLRIAEHIRSRVETDLVHLIWQPTKVTVSVGACEYEREIGLETFLNRANEALHKAKMGGKNRVEFYPRQGRTSSGSGG